MLCKGLRHFAKCCPNNKGKKVQEVNTDSSPTDSEDEINIKTISSYKRNESRHKGRPNSDNSSIYSEESISSKSETSSKAQIKRSKKNKKKMKKMKKSKTIKDEKAEIKELFIGSLASTKLKGISHDWHVALETNNTTIVYKIDTGADANVISYEDYKSLKDKPRIKPVKIKLTAYNSSHTSEREMHSQHQTK